MDASRASDEPSGSLHATTAEQADLLLELVERTSDYAIFLMSPDGLIASWNQGAERLKGYTSDEIIGQHFSVFYTPEDRDTGLPFAGLREAVERGKWRNEGWRVRRDGTRFWANVTITPLWGTDGKHRGFAKITRDLTDRKRNEDALQALVERERSTAERLAELDSLKNDLVTAIAHDLRGPVTVVQQLVELLRGGWDSLSDTERVGMLDRIAKRASSVGAFVNDAFDLARIETGRLEVERARFDVADIVDQVVEDLSITAPDRRLMTSVDRSSIAIGDEQRSWQALANLVSNAVKYSPPDEPVEVTVKRTNDEILVTVTDCGPGIPEEQQPKLFQRFVRLPQASGVPGSGVGLFIARSLVDAQDGRMWVDSPAGTGATFGFALPAAPNSG